MKDDLIGTFAFAGAEGAGNGGRDAGAHAAVGGLQNEHHKGKGERRACKRVSSDAAEKESVEYDHANEGQQVEHVGCCKPQQRGQNWPFKQQFGSRGRRARASSSDGGDEGIESLCRHRCPHPQVGLEQHLRRQRPQEPGGCVKGPEAGLFIAAVEIVRKASFLGLALDYLMN